MKALRLLLILITAALSIFLIYWCERSEGFTNQLASGWAQLGNSTRPEFKQEWTSWDIAKYFMAVIFIVSIPFLRYRTTRIVLAITSAIYLVIVFVLLVLTTGLVLFGADPTYPLLAFLHACMMLAVIFYSGRTSSSSEWVEPHPENDAEQDVHGNTH